MASTQFMTFNTTFTSTDDDTLTYTGTCNFPTNVINASAVVQSWDVGYTSGSHSVAEVGTEISHIEYNSGLSPEVSATVKIKLAADSNHNLKGSVTVLIIAYCS